MTGLLVDDQGQGMGTREVNDADGVVVELISDGEVRATSATVNGVWGFADLAPGSYRVLTRLGEDIADQTSEVMIDSSDVEVGEPLRLTSDGNVRPTPNPSDGAVAISYRVPQAREIVLRIRNLQNAPLRTLVSGLVTRGDHVTTWDGRDNGGSVVTGTMVWVTYEDGSGTRAHLLFR